MHVPVGWGAESGGMVPGKPFFQARFRMCSTWHVFDVSQMLKGRPAAPLSCLRVTWVSGSGTSTAASTMGFFGLMLKAPGAASLEIPSSLMSLVNRHN